MTEIEQVLQRLATLEERSLAHSTDLKDLKKMCRHIELGLTGIKTKVAVFSSIFGAGVSAAVTYFLKN